MDGNRHFGRIVPVAVVLIAANGLGQGMQKAEGAASAAPRYAIAAPKEAATSCPRGQREFASDPQGLKPRYFCADKGGAQAAAFLASVDGTIGVPAHEGASRTAPAAARSGPANLMTEADTGEPAPMGMDPALRGVLEASRRPRARREPWSILERRGDLGFFTVGNFNPVSYIAIENTPHVVVSSNKSSVGGGVEYRGWFSERSGWGLLYSQNPSDGKLLWQGQNYIWQQMRWDMSVLATERLGAGRIAPFVCGGPGIVVTNGYSNSGWSAGFALVGGMGTDYRLSRRLAARAGITFLNTKNGCYDDPTCHETWGVAEDARVGVVYRWGEGESMGLRR